MITRILTALLLALLFVEPCPADEEVPGVLLRPSIYESGAAGFNEFLSRGYTPLFNGKDLSGWRNPYDHGEATVVDGEIHLLADAKFFLVTDRKYTDFRLSIDIHLPEGQANSGVMFRCHVDEDAPNKKVYGYQAECDGSDRRWSGGFYDEARRGWIWPSKTGRSKPEFLKHEKASQAAFADSMIANALNRNGWNRFVVTCIEDRIRIELNGIPTVAFRDRVDASGYIGIQHHGEEGQTYRFRNLFIKEFPKIPAEDSVSLTSQSPVSVKKIDEKITLVDFGKVAFGNVAMRIPQGGVGVGRVHFGEKLRGGRIDRKPPEAVRYGVTEFRDGSVKVGRLVVPAPVLEGNTEQVGRSTTDPPSVLTPKSWLPVQPFRWVEIEGWPGEFKLSDIERRAAFASGWNDEASSFECSNTTLNRIWDLCKYSIKATTFAGVYVDGDRERTPYEADAYLNQLSHYTTDDDVMMAARSFDWLMENGTWPSEWAPHMVFMAHAEWMYSGDVDWLKRRYESLKPKTLMHRSGDDGLVRSSEIDRTKNDIVDWPRRERDGFVFTEINTVVNAFHIAAIKKMAQMARAIGNNNEADAFDARATLATASFQKALFDEQAGIYRDGVGTTHSSIHANLFPLAFGLVPEQKQEGVLFWLEQKKMQCSPYAAQYFMDALFGHGSGEKAMQLMLADGDRSWKHMVNSGTTISWEAWDVKYKPNMDWNHAWGAAPANLLPRYVLGVQPATAGWSTAVIRPCPAGLEYAGGKVPTSRGPINVDWTNDSTFKMSLVIPAGMTATVQLPATAGTKGVHLDGKPVGATKVAGRWVVTEKVTGSATFEVK